MSNRIKPSQWLLLLSLAIGAGVAIGLALLLPGWAWWAYAACGFITASAAYAELVRQGAAEKILDRD